MENFELKFLLYIKGYIGDFICAAREIRPRAVRVQKTPIRAAFFSGGRGPQRGLEVHNCALWKAPGQPPCWAITSSISAMRRMVSLREMTILW